MSPGEDDSMGYGCAEASSQSAPPSCNALFSLVCASVCSGLSAQPARTLAMGVRFLGST